MKLALTWLHPRRSGAVHRREPVRVKLGASVSEGDDWLAITPPVKLRPATIDTYDDHRIAMCFSLAVLGGVPMRINEPDCVRKTFPSYFDEFRALAQA